MAGFLYHRPKTRKPAWVNWGVMKTLIIFFALLLSAAGAFCQTSKDTIVVAPGASGMYFYHVVEKGETIQSLSREFRLSENQLAKLNHLNPSNKLKTYELIKIPLHKDILVQTGTANHSGLTPLYHKVLKGETLYRVGKIYGDIPLSSIRDWNHLKGNNLKAGQYLIIGWLRKKTAIANNTQKETPSPGNTKVTPSATTSTTHTPTAPPATKTAEGDNFLKEVIASERQRATRATDRLAKRAPVSHPLLTANTTEAPDKPSVQNKQTEPAPVSQPLLKEDKQPSVTSGSSNAKEENPFEKILNKVTTPHPKKTAPKENPRQVAKAAEPETESTSEKVSIPQKDIPSKKDTASIALPQPAISENADSSKLELAQRSEFQELYLAQTQDEKVINRKKGAAGWFKSNVKPGSKKYYALCNDLPRGTIVKVINPINNKYVYVKVLASIPQQKENYNLIIKLSNAAMDDLGTSQPRFWSEIVYPKVK